MEQKPKNENIQDEKCDYFEIPANNENNNNNNNIANKIIFIKIRIARPISYGIAQKLDASLPMAFSGSMSLLKGTKRNPHWAPGVVRPIFVRFHMKWPHQQKKNEKSKTIINNNKINDNNKYENIKQF